MRKARELGIAKGKEIFSQVANFNNEIRIFLKSFSIKSIEETYSELLEYCDGDQEKAKQKTMQYIPHIIDYLCRDNVFSHEDEQRLEKLHQAAGITAIDYTVEAKEKVMKAVIVRDLIYGERMQRFLVPADLQFKIQREEAVIWVFYDVELNEVVKTTGYESESDSSGFSLRIAKGVYYRSGSATTRGRFISRENVTHVATGVLAITSHYLYFGSAMNTTRIPHKKIFSIYPTGISVVISRDGNRGKPQEFVVDDPVFLANILKNADNWV